MKSMLRSGERLRANDESFPRFFAKFLLVYSLVVAGYVLWLVNASDLYHWWKQTSFDATTWKAAKGASFTDYRREAMVDDLIGRKLVVGRSKSEVLELLGRADQFDLDADRDLLYWVGSRGMSLEWLAVDIDADGKVAKVFIVRD